MPARLYSGSAQSVHKIPHGQSLADTVFSVFIATRIDDDHTLRHKQRRERNILSHRNITRLGVRYYIVVRHIRTAIHADCGQVTISHRKLNPLIRHQDSLELETLRSPEAYLLHLARSGISVNP